MGKTLNEFLTERPEGFNAETEPLYEFWDAEVTRCFSRRYHYQLKAEVTQDLVVGGQKELKGGSILMRVR